MIDLDPIRAIADRVEIVGDAILIQADCAAVLPLLPKVDAVVTDPPYGIGASRQTLGAGQSQYCIFAYAQWPAGARFAACH